MNSFLDCGMFASIRNAHKYTKLLDGVVRNGTRLIEMWLCSSWTTKLIHKTFDTCLFGSSICRFLHEQNDCIALQINLKFFIYGVIIQKITKQYFFVCVRLLSHSCASSNDNSSGSYTIFSFIGIQFGILMLAVHEKKNPCKWERCNETNTFWTKGEWASWTSKQVNNEREWECWC